MHSLLYMRQCNMTHASVTWPIHTYHDTSIYDMTHSFMCHDSSHVIWLIHVWNDSFMCDMTHKYMHAQLFMLSHDSFMCYMTHSCVTRHICGFDVTYSELTWLVSMRHDSFICDMTHSFVTPLIHVWHDSFTCDMTHSCVIWLIHMWHDSFMCDVTHASVTWLIPTWHDSSTCDMTQKEVDITKRWSSRNEHEEEGGGGKSPEVFVLVLIYMTARLPAFIFFVCSTFFWLTQDVGAINMGLPARDMHATSCVPYLSSKVLYMPSI